MQIAYRRSIYCYRLESAIVIYYFLYISQYRDFTRYACAS
ncbi:hypothetical protein OTSANNIE_1632 [Anaplasma phagocytophilum str. Annie]|nr:hypothetical protein OTSANNIE_1632 [Anaplasma phagocytophilum str. Annie]